MQILICPFCGPRSETEFHFESQAGKKRPTDSINTSIEEWANYLYQQDNPKGHAQEIWVHLPCQEYFIMERDTVTMEVLACRQLNGVVR